MMNPLLREVEELLELEEARFCSRLSSDHGEISEERPGDHHIKRKSFAEGDLVLLYDKKYQRNIWESYRCIGWDLLLLWKSMTMEFSISTT
jgi:hypothetical protein